MSHFDGEMGAEKILSLPIGDEKKGNALSGREKRLDMKAEYF
jgi:hypothetical protein